ncbi:hypothetical protein WDV06_30150 [Streptomyces racemochromogenes]|uniref:Uncharacterized protein n=1 Tax=Streptomyces racemochromogenes TaxID=67353 RepID=A0ABW7PLQ2_9ACTN
MRLRRASIAALGAFTLLLAVPQSASAAIGEFQYTYIGLDGKPHVRLLLDPLSRECITLPEAADPDLSQPAHSPRNRTNTTATVFSDIECDGEFYALRPLVGRGNADMKFRSVVFS